MDTTVVMDKEPGLVAFVLMNLGGDPIPVLDHAGLSAWLDHERRNWAWLNQPRQATNAGNAVVSSTNELLRNVEQQRDGNQPLHVSVNMVEAAFRSGPLTYSGSGDGQRIMEIRERLGDSAGAAAFSFYRQFSTLGDIRTMAGLHGVMAFAFPAMAPVDDTLKDLRAERSNLRRVITEITGKATKIRVDQERRAHLAWWSAARRFIRSQAAMAKSLKAMEDQESTRVTDSDQAFAKAIDDFRTTERAYKEQMELQAPVTYWEAKASRHKAQEGVLKWWVIAYFVLTIPAVVAMFGVAGGWLLGIPAGGGKIDSAMYVVVGAGLAAVTTMALWAGRLLTRFYLSQNHLHHDANDRAVMTRTYLALTSVRAADEKDRAIILAALFRPSADGIVKDDAAPDLGVAGVASKILTGGKS